jgi:hypothetical protein
VVATIWFDVILWFIVGSLVRGSELVGKRVPDDRVGGRHLALMALAMAVFALPVSIYTYVLAPDWAWMYWVDPRPLPQVVVIVACAIADVLALVLGARLNVAAARRFGMAGGAAVHFLGVVPLAIVSLVGWARLARVGDASAFASGTATPLWQMKPFFPIVLAGGAGVGLALGVLSWHASRRPARMETV